jgi:hypothetical protein
MGRTARHGTSLVGLAAALACTVLGGCVDRRFVITSDPPGAVVFVNEQRVGQTPVDKQFTYYGTYRFVLVHEGSETLVVDQPVTTPWYEYWPLEFVSENLIPWTIRDVRRFHYTLHPAQIVPPDALLDRGEQLRAKGRGIGVPVVPQPTPAPANGAVVVPAPAVAPGPPPQAPR